MSNMAWRNEEIQYINENIYYEASNQYNEEMKVMKIYQWQWLFEEENGNAN